VFVPHGKIESQFQESDLLDDEMVGMAAKTWCVHATDPDPDVGCNIKISVIENRSDFDKEGLVGRLPSGGVVVL
jgi:hypothetical protein